jgi:hypothetical protein
MLTLRFAPSAKNLQPPQMWRGVLGLTTSGKTLRAMEEAGT